MDDDTDSPPPRPRPTRLVPSRQVKIKAPDAPARETRATAAYFTSSTSTQTSLSSTETDSQIATRVLRPRWKKRKPTTTPLTASSTPRKATKRQRVQPHGSTPILIRHRHAPSQSVVDDLLFDNSFASLPWDTLPYHVWLRVFDFVAVPIRDPTSRIDDLSEAVTTLLAGARVCRATSEPALAALYRYPPLHRAYHNSTQASFVQFLNTLALPPAETSIRYRPKVEVLRIDVDTSVAKKTNGSSLQLQQILKYLPRLRCLELYRSTDEPPYRQLETNSRWKITRDELLNGLEALGDKETAMGDKTITTVLKSWRWNSRLVSPELSLDHLPEVHSLASFHSLRKVAYVNYQLPSTTEFSARAKKSQAAQDSDSKAIADLAASISALPDLQHLVIESSTLANGSLLERLPKTLAHLELVNCSEVTGEDLSMFLMSHGNSLVRLTLKHCQSLSLEFLPILGTSCPNLAHLEVDLSYFRHHAFYADNKPEYATLLDVDQVPTWPRSIQSIEIMNMRNWTREAADVFFGSLMKNAKALPNLRRLEFKVILNIEWRQRQKMRQSLAEQMARVFKRNSPPPNKHRTLRETGKKEVKILSGVSPLNSTNRRSTRIADQYSTPVSNGDNTPPTGPRVLGSKTFAARESLRSSRRASSKFDADDEESSEDELALSPVPVRRNKSRTATSRKVRIGSEEFIQGLCDVVDIQVDNQRPAERQYDMDDFIDSPTQSETEWNSDEDDVFI